MIAAAVLFLFLGFGLILIGSLKLLFAYRRWQLPVGLIAAGIVLTGLSILLLQIGKGAGLDRVAVGIVVMLTGLVFAILGGWQGLWSPAGLLAGHLPVGGVKLVVLGLGLFIAGILVITLSPGDVAAFHLPNAGIRNFGINPLDNGTIRYVLSLRPQGWADLTLGAFFALLIIGGNVLGILVMISKNAVNVGNILRTNAVLFLVVLGVFMYFYMRCFG